MGSFDLIRKFQSTLPLVRKWIDDVLDGHNDQATAIVNLGFPRLQQVFPSEFLEKARVIVVSGKVPFPPLSRMGLPELSRMENMPRTGITYKDTFFINNAHQSESLHFHELVHVVQWEKLGVDNFLLAYGAGLMQFDYRNSPLEQMAYLLQERFEGRNLPHGIVEFIRKNTDAIWNSIAPMFKRV